MDSDKLRREVNRASLAEQIDSNPVWQEVWQAQMLAIYQGWLDSDDVQERERLHADSQALHRVRSALERIIQTGEMAQAQMNEGSK